jgi:hydrogenase-4 component F
MIMLWILLAVPFLGAVLCFLVSSDRLRRGLLVAVPWIHLGLAVAWWGADPGCPPEAWLGMDDLSLVFLLITDLLFALVSPALPGYLASHELPLGRNRRGSRETLFSALVLAFLGTMTLALAGRHMGIFWMAIEATTLASTPLIAYQRSSRSLEAAWKYLLICSVGIAMALIGNTALAVSAGFSPQTRDLPLTFQGLARHASLLQLRWLKGGFAFLLVGYGTKMGLAPMHTWLPDAHSEAPSPVSALLSGTLLNCAFLGILRTQAILARTDGAAYANGLMVAFGALSMVLAGGFLVGQRDYKRLLAYSSIENMGLLALAAGASAPFGALLHAVNHSLVKGMLFLTAGNLLVLYHSKSTEEVRGILRTFPLTGWLWLAGFLAICGIPPFGSFVSEWTILTALGRGGHWGLLALVLSVLGVVFVGIWKTLIPMVYGEPGSPPPAMTDSLRSHLSPLALGAAALLMGLWIPQPLTRLLERAAAILGAI